MSSCLCTGWTILDLNLASASEHGESVSPQGLVLQGLTWFFSPSHFFPPFLGGGLEQERVRIERPPPQRLSQRDQGLQRDQPPSTTASTHKHENKHIHSIRHSVSACLIINTLSIYIFKYIYIYKSYLFYTIHFILYIQGSIWALIFIILTIIYFGCDNSVLDLMDIMWLQIGTKKQWFWNSKPGIFFNELLSEDIKVRKGWLCGHYIILKCFYKNTI